MLMKRMRLCVFLLLCCGFWSIGAPPLKALAAVAHQTEGLKQTLVINYPNSGIALDGSPTSHKYRGLIYVKIYPISPDLVRKYGAGPMASAEILASGRDVRQLPLGEYEVHFAMRTGSELKTFILRNVILRADRQGALFVQMNSEAKTTIIGGDMTAQEMADTIRELQKQVADLKSQIADMKKK